MKFIPIFGVLAAGVANLKVAEESHLPLYSDFNCCAFARGIICDYTCCPSNGGCQGGVQLRSAKQIQSNADLIDLSSSFNFTYHLSKNTKIFTIV